MIECVVSDRKENVSVFQTKQWFYREVVSDMQCTNTESVLKDGEGAIARLVMHRRFSSGKEPNLVRRGDRGRREARRRH